MRHLHRFEIGCTLVTAVLLTLLLIRGCQNNASEDTTIGSGMEHLNHGPKREDANAEAGSRISFPGIEPVYVSSIQLTDIGSLARQTESPNEHTGSLPSISEFISKCPVSIYSGPNGEIYRVACSDGLYPTIPRKDALLRALKERGYTILGIGNDVSNSKSKSYMKSLIKVLLENGALGFSSPEDKDTNLVEVEIIPVTFRFHSPSDGNSTGDTDLPGVLWLEKSNQITGTHVARWASEFAPTTPFPIEDARLIKCIILPVAHEPDHAEINWINSEGYEPISFELFERKIRNSDTPPDAPIPKPSTGNAPPGSR